MLKQHLKDQYGLTDAKITQYSPSEGAKIYEKNAPRKMITIFMPRPTLHALKENLGMSGYVEVSSKQSLVEKYIEFKQLMLRIDPAEDDEEEKLASTMRAYQVMESPTTSSDVPMGAPPPQPGQLFGTTPVQISGGFMVKFPADGKYTLKKLTVNKLAGRDPVTGRVVVATLGGGSKQKYAWVDNKRHGPKEGPPLVERIINIQYDPCRTARIALVASGVQARYIIATSTMKAGDLISTSGHIPRIAVRPKEADAHPLGALPIGTEVCCIEKYVGEGATVCVNAGTRAILTRKVGDRCIIQLPSKQELSLKQDCMAVVGHVSNEEHSSIPIGSARRLRWLGYRPHSGLWHRKDGRHGRKIRPLPPIKEINQRKVDETESLELNANF
nr:EOG090X0COM [Eurycercus lamellatus]